MQFNVRKIKRFIRIHRLKNVLKDDPLNKKALKDIEEIYEDVHDYERLIGLYLNTLKQTLSLVEKAVCYHKLAMCYFNMAKNNNSKESFETSLNILSEVEEETEDIAEMKAASYYNLYLLSNYNEYYANMALDEYKKIVSEYPQYEYMFKVYLYIASLYEYLSKYDEAIYYCFESLKIAKCDSEKGDSYHSLASIYFKKELYKDSKEYYYKSLDAYGSDSRFYSKIYYELGLLYIAEDEELAARHSFLKAKKYLNCSPWLRRRSDYIREIEKHIKV